MIVRIAAILKVTDPMKIGMLRVQLRALPSIVELYKTRDLAGSPTERVLALKSVSNTCAAVLKAFAQDKREIAAGLRRDVMVPQIIWSLALAIDPTRPEWVIRGGDAERKLEQILGNGQMLKEAADAAIAPAEKDKRRGRGGNRHGRDRVLHDLTVDLFDLYRLITGRDIGTSVGNQTNEPTGPLVGFFALVLPEIGWPMSRKAIRSHIERVRESLSMSRDQFLKNIDPVILTGPKPASTSTAKAASRRRRGGHRFQSQEQDP